MEQPLSIFDVLEIGAVTRSLAIACCDPKVLVQLSLTQSDMHSMISQSGLAPEIASELHRQGASWAKDCTSFEELSLGIDIERMCSQYTKNHLYFQYGGGTDVRPVSKPLLDSAALLGRRHRHLQFQVEAHVGQTAPAGVATMTAQARAMSVMLELGNRGISEDRVNMRAWGRKVSTAWEEQEEDETAARAELFFCFGGAEFPVREAYYDLVPDDKRPPIGNIEEPSDDEEDDDEESMQLPDGQVVPLSLLRTFEYKLKGEADESEGTEGMCLQRMGNSTERHALAAAQISQDVVSVIRQVSSQRPRSRDANSDISSFDSEDLDSHSFNFAPMTRQTTVVAPAKPLASMSFLQPKSSGARLNQRRDSRDVASDTSSLDSEELNSYFFNFVPMTRQTTVAAPGKKENKVRCRQRRR
jgi:hypothetical protein